MNDISTAFDSTPFVKFPSIDRLSNYANLNCTPTIREGTWYRIEYDFYFLLDLCIERSTVSTTTTKIYLRNL